DAPRPLRQRPLARRIEQPLGGELALEQLERDLLLPEPGRLERVHHHLEAAALGIDRELAARAHLEPVGEPELEQRRFAPEQHARELPVGVLEREVDVTRLRRLEVGQFPVDHHRAIARLERARGVTNQLADGPRLDVALALGLGAVVEQRLLRRVRRSSRRHSPPIRRTRASTPRRPDRAWSCPRALRAPPPPELPPPRASRRGARTTAPPTRSHPAD